MRNLVPMPVAEAAESGRHSGRVTGAALLIDAEGSTRLAAELERHGTTGAEALAEVLRAVFGPMVAAVHAAGGFVAEFAGDGIIAVFPGPIAEAARRAAAAGRTILAALGELPSIETPAGPARLLVRGVVGAGEVEWRIWRTLRPEASQNAAYAFVGSAVTEALRGEKLAAGSQLAIGPDAAAALDPAPDLGTLGSGYVSVPLDSQSDWRQSAATSAPGGTGLPKASGWSFFPDKVLQMTRRGEFRDVVSVFVELSELPAGGDDVSAMTRLLDRISDHSGYLCDVIRTGPDDRGVRALAFWGAPTSHEHDIGHALRCIAGLRHDLGGGALRAGVTVDTMFAGYVGADAHESYTCIGAGVNLAARICSAAPWGDIVVDDAIRATLDDRWTYESLGEHDYKGFPRPVPTYRLTRIPAVIRSFPTDTRFVGRDDELAELGESLTSLWQGRSPGVVAVVGESGVGKGHLVAELRRVLGERSPPPVWLSGESNETQRTPLSTLIDALEGYFGGATDAEQGPRLDEYVDQLIASAPHRSAALERARLAMAELLGLEDHGFDALDSATRFDTVAAAIETLVDTLSSIAPVIVHNADAQWLDSATIEILARLRGRLPDRPVAVLLDTRTPIDALPADHTLELGALDRDDVASLAESVLGKPPSPELVSLLMERSSGNPFFAREILDFMRRELLFVDGPEGLEPRFQGDGLPADLRRIVIADLDDLGADVERTVQIAAVLGQEFDVAVLARIVGSDDDVRDHLDVAERARIVEVAGDETCRFRHAVVRDTAYGMQLHAELRQLHLAAHGAIIAHVGDTDDVADQLALHADRGGEPALATRHYLAAARHAAQGYANAEALEFVERGLELAESAARHLRYALHETALGVHDTTGEREAQAAIVAAMAELAETPEQRLDAEFRRSQLLIALGSFDEAASATTAALDAAGSSDSVMRGRLRLLLAQLARYAGDAESARRHAEMARDDIGPGSEREAATIEDFLGGVAFDLGEFEEAARRHRLAANRFAEGNNTVGEIRALNNLGTALFSLGDFTAARDIHEQGAARSRGIGYRLGEGDHLDNAGGVAWAIGDHDEALTLYGEALAIRHAMDDAWGVAVSTNNLAGVYRALGDLVRAAELYEEALSVDRGIGRRRGEAYDLHGLGLTRLASGDLPAAIEALDEAIAIREALGERHLYDESKVACAVAHKRLGNQARAWELVTDVIEDGGYEHLGRSAEPAAAFAHAIEALDGSDTDRVTELREKAREIIRDRADAITDGEQRRNYLARASAQTGMELD